MSNQWFERCTLMFSLMAISLAGCQGELSFEEGRRAYAVVAGCAPEQVKCTFNSDGSSICGCGALWDCNANYSKCTRPRFAPNGESGWSCIWSKESYTCNKQGQDFTGSIGWQCAHDDELGWECSRPSPTPNRKAGDDTWECHVYDNQGRIFCLRDLDLLGIPEICDNLKDDDCDGLVDKKDPDCQLGGACLTEICHNGVDDDCDALVDVEDPDCTPLLTSCAPQPEVCGNKTDDDCDGYADCDDPDCNESCEFTPSCSWQTLECDGEVNSCQGNDQCYRDWVDQRCNGEVLITIDGDEKTFTCADNETCVTYRCQYTPSFCFWSEVECPGKSCEPGDEGCAKKWVTDQCQNQLTTSTQDGNKVFKCTDKAGCMNYSCQVIPPPCTWSNLDCEEQNSCTPGDEACYKKWITDRCDGPITSATEQGKKVFKCKDGEPVCKNYRCQVEPPPQCTWDNYDCAGKHQCQGGDEACFKKWVDDRCGGSITTAMENGRKVFKCQDGKPVCKNYRCEVVPLPQCTWNNYDCAGKHKCKDGDEACFKKWVDDRCQGKITTTVKNGNKIFKCTDGEPLCNNYQCEVVLPVCNWTHHTCGNASGCNPGDEACTMKWVDDRCQGQITVSKNKQGNNVYSCTDDEPICKTFTCETKPQPPCIWETFDCHAVETIGHCNKHSGDNEQACYAAGRGSCTDDELYAWCTRRVAGLDGPGGPWWTYIRKWVEDRCGGPAVLGPNAKGELTSYRCVNDARCEIFTCETPLVLLFDPGLPVAYHDDDGSSSFDLSAHHDGGGVRTDWPTAVTPWLALDVDHDGRISSGQELFGSAMRLADGSTAPHGFAALAALDQNQDGQINARDADFEHLRLWYDHNGNRVSEAHELRTLAEMGILELSLQYEIIPRCDSRGNCERERATFIWRDARDGVHKGALVDIHLKVRGERVDERGTATASRPGHPPGASAPQPRLHAPDTGRK